MGQFYLVLVVAGLTWYIAVYGVAQVGSLITVISALTALLGLPAVLFTSFRTTKVKATLSSLEEVATHLAQSVRLQWEAEARVRRLNDPQPLPVAWTAADAHLVEPWPLLRELAEDWPRSGDASRWAVSQWGLSGQGGEIEPVFRERVPTRRLVVLGDPGAGKTMLLVRLLLALLERQQVGEPVPVLFTLASWDPSREDLYTWMAGQLTLEHPALRAPASQEPSDSCSNWAQELLKHRLVLPLLDGLDELPQALRSLALDKINYALLPGQGLVLSSRTTEYQDALTTSAGSTVVLNGAAGIRLLPLDSALAVTYLQRDAGGPSTPAAARWGRVAVALSADTPIAQALSTPLGLFLARTIYNPRPGEDTTHLGHPDELLNPHYQAREDIDVHLFDAFIPAAYRLHPQHPLRWKSRQAQRTLVYLARHLEDNLGGTPDIAWWQLHKAVPKYLPALAVGIAAVVVVGLAFGLTYGLAYGLAAGLITGGMFGGSAGIFCGGAAVKAGAGERKPSTGIRWVWENKSERVVMNSLLAGFGAGIAAGFRSGYLTGLGVGFAFLLITGFTTGITSAPLNVETAVGPTSVLTRDRRTFWTLWLGSGLAVGLLLGFIFGVLSGGDYATGLVIGLTIGLLIGHVIGLSGSVWWQFLVARFVLALSGHVPWRLMAFMADAHQRRGVLRQMGAVYQFRHFDLQRHLSRRHS
ncbi:NACHT domain-containing protein [Streptomyces sp. NPDC029721]|uniref:NACHT domain-containing protein n=1 Tax=Streptomyces sp. NPDC029721 TaxID=3157090 RepID=UPI0033FB0A37